MRKGIVYALIVWLFVLAVLAYHGNFFLFALYLVGLANAVAFHWWYACSRCSNMCCGFNPRGPHFFLLPGKSRTRYETPEGYSNKKAWVAGTPVLACVLVGVTAAAMYDLWLTVGWLAVMAALGYVYMRVSCVGCGNDCPANTNPEYLAWRQGRGKDQASDR